MSETILGGTFDFDDEDVCPHGVGFDEECEECSDDDESAPFCFRCQNSGTVPCRCGGDLCFCENNGEQDCPECDRGEY